MHVPSTLSSLFGVLLLTGLVACGGLEQMTDVPQRHSAATTTGEHDDVSGAFWEAEATTGTPMELLVAISHVETRQQMVVGEVEFEGRLPGYGVMGLRDDLVLLGADLTGLDPDTIRYERDANIEAAGAVMALWADEEGIDASDLDAWAPVVARYSGITQPDPLAEYVHHEVYATLAKGVESEGGLVPPLDVDPEFPLPTGLPRTGAAGTLWTPSPNHSSRSGSSVDFVIIHTCEGSYSSCWDWLTRSNSGVSAHYVVNNDGSQVRHLVDEDRKSWHIAADYDCGRNGGLDCWRDGTSTNRISVGIEHAGYASQSSWDTDLIQRSAELTCGITQRHGVPIDSYHVVGHGQLQPWNRSDPGANWPWADYLSRAQTACGTSGGGSPSGGGGSPSGGGSPTGGGGSPTGGGGSPTGGSGVPFIIDSNNSANDTSRYYMDVSASWWASANVSGYYNTGYWVAPTAAVSDPASFWFQETAVQCYRVEGRWSAASDRPPAITFLGWDANDAEVGRKTVNQQIHGGTWNHLGDWKFGPGWNRVLLSRWASPGDYAIADAVRLTPSTACP